MFSLASFPYCKESIPQIRQWHYGTNWPSVYICYNDKKAYVGETLDAVRRTEQHLQEPEFNQFTDVCFISHIAFNKSVILDLESFLIKYMGADGKRELTNGNAGIVDHNYFYKEAYHEDFKELWRVLLDKGIVGQTLLDIENSELYKYSPYKTLNREQLDACYSILQRLYEINSANSKSLIQVLGGAGTGKTILAVYLVKLLVDIKNNKAVWAAIDESDDATFLRKMAEKLTGIQRIGFVVPMVQLREAMKRIFKSAHGLSEDMILSPEDVVKGERYDVLIVDEAHRLYRRKHLPGSHLYTKFDNINKQLMGDSFTGTENDLTELDWVIHQSRIQILFYDSFQTIRATDIGVERFNAICQPRLYKQIELTSQMRCKGGNGYYEYVKQVLETENLSVHAFRQIEDYQIEVVDSITSLFDKINKHNQAGGLCRVITGPGWKIEDTIEIDGNQYHWATDSGISSTIGNKIYSIHKIQGFDLNYAGVIFGKEIFYNPSSKRIEINKQQLEDSFTKSDGDDKMRQFILNIYLTLMTRGINGTYVYAVDSELRKYLSTFFKGAK